MSLFFHEDSIQAIQNNELENQRLKDENILLKAMIQAESDRRDFMEDCMAEMAVHVYGI